MDIDEILMNCEEAMENAVNYLTEELKGIRSGRASPALVEFVKVDYYGSMTDLRQLANVQIPEPAQILIKPFDASAIQAIVKAIQGAGLGLNPVAEGKAVRLHVPPLSRERRQQLSGSVKQMGEQSKVTIRNARRDANKAIDSAEKDKSSGVTEDDAHSAKDEVQGLTKRYEDRVEKSVKSKTEEIMEL